MFSFKPTEEQQMMVDAVQQFSTEQVRPLAHEADERREFPAAVLAAGKELGLLAGNLPESYGGFAEKHSAVTGALLAEELAYGDLAYALHLLAPSLVAVPLLEAGSEAQKARFLPLMAGSLAGGQITATAAFIEPRWNFNGLKPQTVATRGTVNGRANGHYMLNGTKTYVPLAAEAQVLLVYAHDQEADSVQAFIVNREEVDSSQIVLGEREKLMGIRALPTYTVTFKELEVPAGNRLGGAAGVAVQHLINYSRVALGALATGVARAAYDYAREYAKQRTAFGKPIAQFQAIAFMLAEMAIEVDAMRLLTWEAAWELDSGQEGNQAAALAHQYTVSNSLMVADRAVQILGGHGYIREHPVERWLREARGFATFEGMAIV